MLRELQRRCFAGSQAYGLVTLLVLYFWSRSHIILACAGERIVGCAVGDSDRGQTRVLNSRRSRLPPSWDRDRAPQQHRGLLRRSVRCPDGRGQKCRCAGALPASGYLPVSDLRNYYGRNRHGILSKSSAAHPRSDPCVPVLRAGSRHLFLLKQTISGLASEADSRGDPAASRTTQVVARLSSSRVETEVPIVIEPVRRSRVSQQVVTEICRLIRHHVYKAGDDCRRNANSPNSCR